jgi:hypothetical protein
MKELLLPSKWKKIGRLMNEAFDAEIGKGEMRGVLNSYFEKTTNHLLSSSTTAFVHCHSTSYKKSIHLYILSCHNNIAAV